MARTEACGPTEVILVDDRSTDATRALAREVAERTGKGRLRIVAGQDPPVHQRWSGKNWACHQGLGAASGDWLLFLDCDARLMPNSLDGLIGGCEAQGIDLLTLMNETRCGSLMEYAVEPLYALHVLIAVGLHRPGAICFGPFMLFRAGAYRALGGHAAISDQVLDDLVLARRTREAGFRVAAASGAGRVAVRMYRRFGALWEGRTKNFYLALGGNLSIVAALVLALCSVYVAPVVALSLALADDALASAWTLALAASALAIQASLWMVGRLRFGIPLLGFILAPIGALVLSAIAIASMVKVRTRRAWTWRGRDLRALNDPRPPDPPLSERGAS